MRDMECDLGISFEPVNVLDGFRLDWSQCFVIGVVES